MQGRRLSSKPVSAVDGQTNQSQKYGAVWVERNLVTHIVCQLYEHVERVLKQCLWRLEVATRGMIDVCAVGVFRIEPFTEVETDRLGEFAMYPTGDQLGASGKRDSEGRRRQDVRERRAMAKLFPRTLLRSF